MQEEKYIKHTIEIFYLLKIDLQMSKHKHLYKIPVSCFLSFITEEFVKYPNPSFILTIKEKNLHIRIKKFWDQHGKYYQQLVKTIIKRRWVTEIEAMKEARENLICFYEALDTMSRDWHPPFTALIDDLDKVLKSKSHTNGKQTKETWSSEKN